VNRRQRKRRSGSRAAAAQRRYRRAVFTVLEQRGEECECCHAAARHVHHIITVATSGIDSELAFEPANMMVLCNECHALMHPGSKNRNMWWRMNEAGQSRGHALNRVGR
jgi:5-methylcytosine-specific restriction endonuclease McrA